MSAHFSTIKMLADVNTDLVTATIPDAKSMPRSREHPSAQKASPTATSRPLQKLPGTKRTTFQRETNGSLGENPGIGNLKALVERKCIVGKNSYKGGKRAPWGIPAHLEGINGLETNVRYLNGGIPTELCLLSGRRYRSTSGADTARIMVSTSTRQLSPKLSPASSPKA